MQVLVYYQVYQSDLWQTKCIVRVFYSDAYVAVTNLNTSDSRSETTGLCRLVSLSVFSSYM